MMVSQSSSQQSFPRGERLLSALDYRQVFQGFPKKLSNQHWLLLAIKQDHAHSRLGMAIAKKKSVLPWIEIA
jgi:RNase P protein component